MCPRSGGAPRRWHTRKVRDLVDRHWTPMVLEPSVMVLLGESVKTTAICMWHVDGIQIAGQLGDEMWEQEFEAIRHLYGWFGWQTGKREQCGLIVKQNYDMLFTVDL